MTIVLLGAPTNEQLRRSWKPEYAETEVVTFPTQTGHGAAWRLLPSENKVIIEHEEIDHSALEISYAVFCQEDLDIDRPLTQLPDYDFDMSSVKDIEDLYHVPLLDKHERPRMYSVLCAVLSISAAKDIVTKAGKATQVVILSLGDQTSCPFELAAWGSHAQYVLKFVQRLDVILIEDFVLSMFHSVLGGTSRASRTRFSILYRTERRAAYDDQFRPLLLDDAQSDRVRRVRDWVITWVPGETQPESTNASIFSLR